MKKQLKWSKTLIRIAAIFGIIGAGLGAHMAGAGSLQFRPIHAHILVAGFLTLLAWGIYYRMVKIRAPRLVSAHVYTAIIGSIGLTVGMWLEFMEPFPLPDFVNLLTYIIGGSILLVSFILFFATTFFMVDKKHES
ncbi:hypothetical protein ACDX78_01415 [Virgibacillus oceani]